MADARGDRRLMRLRVLLPTRELVDLQVSKVVAEACNGAFCLLPRHVDFVAALVPGILAYTAPGQAERYLAIDEGTLVKRADDVLVSVVDAVAGDSLEDLRSAIEGRFLEIGEDERLARSAIARLEAAALRGLMEMERGERG